MSEGGRAVPGSRVTAIGMDAYRVVAAGQSQGIVQGTGADWFGPLNPMAPVAPPEVMGRALDYNSGYNLEITPRPYEPIKFSDLRNLAECYDIARLCIETRKDQMERLAWNIVPKVLPNGETAAEVDDPRIIALTKFFTRPDGEHYWGTWLRMLLEDMLVIDAATLFKRKLRGGGLAALEVIDGATIKRVITDWGRTPAPPAPAYQQVLKGFPAVNYTTDQMLYLPRNIRISKFYGYSPIEQIVMSVNIALRRQLFQLNYYTDGNMPEALVGTPDAWTVDQVTRMQNSFDGMLAGNLAARRRIKFIPGGVAKNFVALKEPDLTGAQDEWLARMVCYAFSLPPTPFVKQMNRATAQSAHDTALEEGLAPLQLWVKQMVDHVITEDFGFEDLEFGWVDDREVDPLVQMEVLTGYTKAGGLKINEMRDQLGQPPVPGGDVAMVMTANGYVPIDVNADMPTAGERADQAAQNAKAALDAKSQGQDPNAKGGGDKGGAPSGDAKEAQADGSTPVEPDGDSTKIAGGAIEKVAATFRKARVEHRSSSAYDPRYGSLAKRRRALRKASSPRLKGHGAADDSAATEERLFEDTEQGE